VRLIAFVDLDDTLFSTRRKHPAHLVDADLTVGTVNARGEPHGFQTARQAAMFEHLRRHGTVVPVTGRSAEAYARVRLPFTSFRVLDHGATIITPDGTPDAVYTERLKGDLAPHGADFERLTHEVAALARDTDPELRARVHDVHGLPIYVVVKHPDRRAGALRALAALLHARLAQNPRWHVFSNDSTLTVMQAAVSKRRAVTHLRAALDPDGEALTVGVGDTLSDVPFMSVCDVVMTPANSQIVRVLGGLHHVHD